MPSYHKPYEYGYNEQSLNIQYGNGQNIGGHGGGEHDPQNEQERLEKLLSVGNNLIWYVALIPLFGLVFEMYADSKLLGVFLWGLIIVIRILVCRYDNKKLSDMGLWDFSASPWLVLFPVAYIFKRSKWLGRSYMPVGIAVGCMILAILNNGFAEAMTYNENNYYTFVSEYYTSYINNLPDDDGYTYSTDYTIDSLLNSYCFVKGSAVNEDTLVSYKYEKSGGRNYVTATGTKNGEKLSIVFLLDYDGYYYGGMDIEEVTLGGKTLEGEQRDKVLKDIFMFATE